MKTQIAKILILLLTLTISVVILYGETFAIEITHQNIAVLTMKKFGPPGAGTITPVGTRIIKESGEIVTISATAHQGYSFSSWTIKGGAVIEDTLAETTNVTLTNNAIVTANFVHNDTALSSSLTVLASPSEGGVVTPDETVVNIGQIQQITTTANSSYKFIEWRVNGNAEVDDVYSATTNVVIKGPAVITSLLIDEAQALNLDIKSDEGGFAVHEGSFNIIKGNPRKIKAYPLPGYIFVEWKVEGEAVLSNDTSSETYITATDNASVTAQFEKMICTFSHKNRKIMIKKHEKMVKNKDSERSRDFVSIKNLPICISPEQFNPNTDTINIIVEGNNFTINKENGTFKRYKHGYKFKSFDGIGQVKNEIKLILNFTKSVWSFRARKNMKQIDNTDGIEIKIAFNGEYNGIILNMEEKVIWNYKMEKDSFEDMSSSGKTFKSYSVSNAKGVYKNYKDLNDKIIISNASLNMPEGVKFDNENQPVILTFDDESLVIPAGSFYQTEDNLYVYDNREQGILLKFDFNKQKWFFKYTKFNGWGNIYPEDINIYLSIGNIQSGTKIIPSYKKILKYNFNKFYWKNNQQ